MASTLIAVPSDLQTVGDQQRYTISRIPIDTLARLTGAVPLLVPPLGENLDVDGLLSRIDGVFVPGGLTNVAPVYYGRASSQKDGPFDVSRDRTTLPLIRTALLRGVPLLMTCRGFQELNVALGGTLKQEPDELPDEKKHGTPASARTDDERYRLRQNLNIKPGGQLARIVKQPRILVNSLHSDLVDQLAPGLIVEATADDGSVEAVSVEDAKGFALGVIFHPEYWAEHDEPSLAILKAFAKAVHEYATSEHKRMAA